MKIIENILAFLALISLVPISLLVFGFLAKLTWVFVSFGWGLL